VRRDNSCSVRFSQRRKKSENLKKCEKQKRVICKEAVGERVRFKVTGGRMKKKNSQHNKVRGGRKEKEGKEDVATWKGES